MPRSLNIIYVPIIPIMIYYWHQNYTHFIRYPYCIIMGIPGVFIIVLSSVEFKWFKFINGYYYTIEILTDNNNIIKLIGFYNVIIRY